MVLCKNLVQTAFLPLVPESEFSYIIMTDNFSEPNPLGLLFSTNILEEMLMHI